MLDERKVAEAGSARAMFARMVRPLVISVAVCLAIYIASVILGDYDRIVAAMARIGVGGWAAILAMSLLNYALRFVRWHWYIAVLSVRVPAVPNFWIYLSAFAFATTPGKAGEAVRSLYLLPYGVPVSSSLAAFLIERFMDLVAIMALSSLAAIHFEESRWVVVLAAAATALLFAIYRGTWALRVIETVARSVRSPRVAALLDGLHRFQRDAGVLLRGRLFAGALGLGLLAWAAEGLGFVLTLRYLGVDAPALLLVGIYSVSILAGALSFIPGGIGSTEAVMGLLLVLVGVDTSTAVAATIVCRLATLWFAVAVGMGCLGVIELRGRARQSGLERAR